MLTNNTKKARADIPPLTDLAQVKRFGSNALAGRENLSLKAVKEIRSELLESEARQYGEKCIYAAPYICYPDAAKKWHLVQGCCNHWDCPRCGQIRARQEYGRMVEGAKKIEAEGKKMYFWTLTCRGKELPLSEAENGYLKWTNLLLTKARGKASRSQEYWCYASVTERQTRKHPHSHMICTYCPDDAWPIAKGEINPLGYKQKQDGLWSDWFVDANRRAGLGEQCQISKIRSAVAVSTYLAKYMFEDSASETWPKGWKRVRYSNNWPKLPEIVNPGAFPVVTHDDWEYLAHLGRVVQAEGWFVYQAAIHRGLINVSPPKGREKE